MSIKANFKVQSKLEINEQTESPLIVSSSELVTNLNADLLDGLHADDFANLSIFTATKEPTGFPNRIDSTISFNNGTRTFTIAPIVDSYDVYILANVYTKSSELSIVWPDIEGIHFFYFDATGTLSTTQIYPIDTALVAYVYWDISTSSVIIFGEERHGITMDSATHEYLHATIGTRYASGLTIGNYTTSGTGDNDGDCTVSISTGVVYDEDIKITITHSNSPVNEFEQFIEGTLTGLAGTPTTKLGAKIPVYYRLGTNGDWVKIAATNAPVVTGPNRAYYNYWNGSTWALRELVSNSDYLAMWLYATNNINGPIIAIMGQSEEGTILNARANFIESSLSWGTVPFREVKVLYRLIYQSYSSYTNNYNARLVDVTDFRVVSSVSGVSALSQSHSVLSNLSSDDHPQYLLLAGRTGDAATNIQLNSSRVRQATNQTASSGTVYLDYSTGDYFKVTASGNITISLSNMPSGFVSSLTLEATNFGAYIITWPVGTKWAGGTVPTMTSSGIDLISFLVDSNGNKYGSLLLRDAR